MTAAATSIHGITIRLPAESWQPIIRRHSDLADQKERLLQTISAPARILQGNDDALMAPQEIKPRKRLVVIYKEADTDGFVVTAFSTRKIDLLNRRQQRWP